MKAKIQAILTGMPQNDVAYTKVVHEMPEIITPAGRHNARLGEGATRYEIQLASQIRSASFLYRVPAIERTASQNRGYSEDDGDREDDCIEVPARSSDAMIDPRLTEAALDFDMLERETSQSRLGVDEMDIDVS